MLLADVSVVQQVDEVVFESLISETATRSSNQSDTNRSNELPACLRCEMNRQVVFLTVARVALIYVGFYPAHSQADRIIVAPNLLRSGERIRAFVRVPAPSLESAQPLRLLDGLCEFCTRPYSPSSSLW